MFSILALTMTLLPAPATPPTTQPDYSAFDASYHVPFARKVDFNHLQALHVRISINGGPPTSFQVDTGSVGIIVGADEVPNIDPNARAGSITYNSSGVELDGVWTNATITFPDVKDNASHVATAVVPVLAASVRTIHDGAVNGGNAKPSTNPKVHMFGIGFGRGKDAHPERNPFLNLNEMNAGTMHRGYTITRDGFTLGLTSKRVGDGYVFQKLVEREVSRESSTVRPTLKDWESARGSIIVDGKPQPDAAILIDTGLTNMMIGVPELPRRGDIRDGTPITVNLLGGLLSYEFKVGDESNPTTPRKVTWTKPSTGQPSLNTGLRTLSAFDYLYDADNGYLGLRPVHRKTDE